MSKGQSLELFFVDGNPEGMLTAQIFNWTGHVLMTPRTQLAEALRRPEAKRTGIYILLGDSVNGLQSRAYIGESEDVGGRIRTHDLKVDWWTSVVIVSSAANSLNKAHVKYLESRLVEEARRAGRLEVVNGNTPPRPPLSESAVSDMEQFVTYLLTTLPAIRIDGFLQKARPDARSHVKSGPNKTALGVEFKLKTPKHGVDGTALLQGSEFILQPGSVGRLAWEGNQSHSYSKLFEEVVESGLYVQDGALRRFTEAYAFPSASAAAAVLNGRTTNGPEAWKLLSDPRKSYKQWEAEQLNQS